MFELITERLYCKIIKYKLSYKNFDLYDIYDTIDQQMLTLIVFEEKNRKDTLSFKELSNRFKKLKEASLVLFVKRVIRENEINCFVVDKVHSSLYEIYKENEYHFNETTVFLILNQLTKKIADLVFSNKVIISLDLRDIFIAYRDNDIDLCVLDVNLIEDYSEEGFIHMIYQIVSFTSKLTKHAINGVLNELVQKTIKEKINIFKFRELLLNLYLKYFDVNEAKIDLNIFDWDLKKDLNEISKNDDVRYSEDEIKGFIVNIDELHNQFNSDMNTITKMFEFDSQDTVLQTEELAKKKKTEKSCLIF